MNRTVRCATFSKSLNPQNIDKSISDIRIRIRFPFESSFWISLSGCKLTILPDIQPANRIVIISAGNTHSKFSIECVFPKKYFEMNKFFFWNMQDLQSWQAFFASLLQYEIYHIQKCLFIIKIFSNSVTTDLLFVNTAKLLHESRHAIFSFAFAWRNRPVHLI